MLRDQRVIDRFVTSDFHLFDKTLRWIQQNNLLTGTYFCELGAGFGVCAMLASLQGMEAVGIEIEPDLVEQASRLTHQQGNAAKFFCGSFVPPGTESHMEEMHEEHQFSTSLDGSAAELDREFEDFDILYAFPWPGEYPFIESMFDDCAAVGALLLTYRGREGMHLLRKV